MSIFEQQEHLLSENLTVRDTSEEVIFSTMINQAGAFTKIISQSSSAEEHTEDSLQDSESQCCYQTTFVMDPFVGKNHPYVSFHLSTFSRDAIFQHST